MRERGRERGGERERAWRVYGEYSLAAEGHVQVKPLSRDGVGVRWWTAGSGRSEVVWRDWTLDRS